MTRKPGLIVKETIEELQNMKKDLSPGKQKRLDMLILTKTGEIVTKSDQAKELGISERSVQEWRGKYMKDGLDYLLMERRGGDQKSTFDPRIKIEIKVYMETINKGDYSLHKILEWLFVEHKHLFDRDLSIWTYKAIKRYMNRTYGKSPIP